MEKSIVLRTFALDEGWILTPERYDPRRNRMTHGNQLTDYVEVVNEQVSKPRPNTYRKKQPRPIDQVLVIDTSDAREGILLTRRKPVPISELNSAKKLVRVGDVIISRLRPYLRQVSYVDEGLLVENGSVQLCVSTEFFVLRSRTPESIAFLVPFLLSDGVQNLLAASQEGGHHPRFTQSSLLKLAVPHTVHETKRELSLTVEESVRAIRHADHTIEDLVASMSKSVEEAAPIEEQRIRPSARAKQTSRVGHEPT